MGEEVVGGTGGKIQKDKEGKKREREKAANIQPCSELTPLTGEPAGQIACETEALMVAGSSFSAPTAPPPTHPPPPIYPVPLCGATVRTRTALQQAQVVLLTPIQLKPPT